MNDAHAYGRQRGVALITALLVVAIAASVATALARQQQLTIQRSTNVLNTEQAWHERSRFLVTTTGTGARRLMQLRFVPSTTSNICRP